MSKADWPEAISKIYHQRWRIWIVVALAHTVSLFHRGALAPAADKLMADFDISAVVFGSLGAVYFYVYAAMQLPSGTLADTLGPRKTITTGLLLSTLGSLIMSIAPSFGVVYTGRLLVSLGVSIIWLSIVKILIGWFRTRERATILGLSGFVAQLGGLAATTPLALLITWVGWRMSFVAISLVSLALAGLNWVITKDSPTQAGLPSLYELERHTTSGVTPLPDSSAYSLSLAQRFKIVISNKHLWAAFLWTLGSYGAFATLFQNWAVIYIMQMYDLPRYSAANFVFITTIGFMIGLPVIGLVSDRILHKRRLPAVLLTGLSLTLFLLLALWNNGRPPIGALYLLCFFIGLFTSSTPLALAYVGDIVQPHALGIATGLVNMGTFVGAAISQPLFGYMLDLKWEGQMIEGIRIYPLEAFQQGFFLCSILAALGFLGTLLVKETHCRDSYNIS